MANPYISEQGKATRFKPGQSGNPKGRPKGSRNYRTLLREAIEGNAIDWSLIPIQGIEKLAAKHNHPMEAVIYRAYAQAIQGDARARQWLTDTLYGKNYRVTVHHVTDGPQPVPIYEAERDGPL